MDEKCNKSMLLDIMLHSFTHNSCTIHDGTEDGTFWTVALIPTSLTFQVFIVQYWNSSSILRLVFKSKGVHSRFYLLFWWRRVVHSYKLYTCEIKPAHNASSCHLLLSIKLFKNKKMQLVVNLNLHLQCEQVKPTQKSSWTWTANRIWILHLNARCKKYLCLAKDGKTFKRAGPKAR